MNTAITFDDVLLVPAYNHWESRRVVDISMLDRSGKLKLDLPLMSSNMDTITGVEMANFMGDNQGIGVLHRFMSIDENVAMWKACRHDTFVSVGCSEEGDLPRRRGGTGCQHRH